MVTSLFKHNRIRTTDKKAKELRRWADNLITLAKRGDLHARRQALAIVREKDVVHKLFEEAQDRFGATSGGYTRISRLGRRPGDAAPISLIELISAQPEKKKKKRKKKAAPVDKKADAPASQAVEDTPEAASEPMEEAEAKTETVETDQPEASEPSESDAPATEKEKEQPTE
jgi:large subunit ribosomal protein L17